MNQDTKLWIVVADGEHARFVTPSADGVLHTVETLTSENVHKHAAELGSDRPGRSFESVGSTRHAVAAKTDLHDLEKQKFAQLVAHQLASSQAAGAFERLVLVAPAHALHDVREALDGPTAAKLVGTLAKDLVKTPNDELQPHLHEWVGPASRRGLKT